MNVAGVTAAHMLWLTVSLSEQKYVCAITSQEVPLDCFSSAKTLLSDQCCKFESDIIIKVFADPFPQHIQTLQYYKPVIESST